MRPFVFLAIAVVLFLAPRAHAADPAPPRPGMTLVAADDCGAKGPHPYLLAGSPGALSAEDVQRFSPADIRDTNFVAQEKAVRFRFVGVRPDASYVLRVRYFNIGQDRSVKLLSGETELHGTIALPIEKPLVREASVPRECYRDASLAVSVARVEGAGALVSAVELWSDKPGLLGPVGAFIRFRVESIPATEKGGLAITARMKIHASPWTTPVFPLNGKTKITEPGVTEWVDLRKLPGEARGSLMLQVPAGARGATEFSCIGAGDYGVRRFDWSEPDGTKIILDPSLSDVRTFRDQERRYYLNTLRASGEKLYPLTRPPLYFSPAWGYASGGAAEYMVRNFRLMGFNSAVTSDHAELYEKLFGWNSQGAQYAPPGVLPYSEEKTKAAYADFYRKYFEKGGRGAGTSPQMAIFQLSDEPGEAAIKDTPEARAGFHAWLAQRGVSPEVFEKKSLEEVPLSTAKPTTPQERRVHYWSRRYQAFLTPRMFALAADAVREQGPAKSVQSYVALSGHSMNFPSRMPLDMFQLAQYPGLMPGISDWMTSGSWWWDSHQSVAFSVAMFNGGARRYGVGEDKPPISFPMMHAVYASPLRVWTQLSNNCKLISYYNYGPDYEVTEGFWSNVSWMPGMVAGINNRVAQVDDLFSPGVLRRSRVAILWSAAQDVWWPQGTFNDKRAAFLAMSHDYFQPELITEDQVRDGALGHYDALYLIDHALSRDVRGLISGWVNSGGLLWACADAASQDEYFEPCDLLEPLAGLRREYKAATEPTEMSPVSGESALLAQPVPVKGRAGEQVRPGQFSWEGARGRAKYADESPAVAEKAVGKGRLFYVAHRAGLSYSLRAGKRGPFANWPAAGREVLVAPLLESGVRREAWMSAPLVQANALSSAGGTVVVLFDLNASPTKDVTLNLREPARPHSVQTFDDAGSLVAMPFEYVDGVVNVPIRQVNWNGQLVIVRRVPAPEDGRIAAMRATAEAGFASDNWQTLSASAWFAGFFPDWKLAAKIVPLLKHSHWAVRRSAAEALGRLNARDAGDAVRDAAKVESDSHALADELYALARLGHREAAALCAQHAASPDPFIRREARRAAELLTPSTPASPEE